MAILTLSTNDTVGLSFGSFNIIGTRSGRETVILSNPISGNLSVTLDPSFNQGGDTIVLAGTAADYTIVRSGSSVIMTNGSITVTIPVGVAGANVVFANGAGSADDDVRVLRFDTTLGVVLDGGVASEFQVVGNTATAVAVNDRPVVANALADVTVAEDTAVSVVLPANAFSDADGDALTLSASGMPAWLSFNAATRTFSGTPPLNFNGSVNVTVTATDAGGLSASDTFALTITPVNDAPVVANALADVSGTEDTAVSFTIPANAFSDVDSSLTLTATGPAWLSFDAATRTFSGTPPLNFNGSVDVTVTASDGSLSVSDTFTLTLAPVNDAPVVANLLPDVAGTEDTAVSFSIPSNTFSDVDNASLTLTASGPAWLTFDAATRTFSGTPPLNANGPFNVTVTASDGSLSVSDTFVLTLAAVNDAPVVANPLADVSAPEDTVVSFTLPADAFTDVDSSLTLSASGMPAWLSFDAATRTFSGTPPQDFNGFVDVTVTASDGTLSASDTFRLTVTPVIDVAVSAASVTEGDPSGPARQVTFTLTLDTVPTAPVSVAYFTAAGTATANDDFVPTAGIVTFVPGQTVAFVSVPIIGDLTVEPNEAFTLTASVVGTPSTIGITSTGTGTIIENDVVQGTLTANQDTLLGTVNNDIFIGQNRNLNAGDSISGDAGVDILNFATDASVLGNGPLGTGAALFGGFTFNGLEIFSVTNDSNRTNVFDLSGTAGLQVVEAVNSSASIEFRNLAAETQTLNISDLTNDTSDVDVTLAYRDAAVAGGSNAVTVNIDESTVNLLRIGSNSDDDAGIETVTLNVTGNSTIENLDTAMSVLDINGAGSIAIQSLDNQSNLSQIDASGAGGTVNLSFSAAPGPVSYLGSTGSDIVTGNNANGTSIDTGNGDDVVTDGAGGGNTTITTGAGTDTVNSRSGNDTISTGSENDTVNVTSTGLTAVDTGSGADIIDFAAGTFDADVLASNQDVVNGGDDRDELRINQSAADNNFEAVSGIEILTLNTAGTTVTLGTEGSEAGIDTINLSTGNDTVTAIINTRNLTVNSRGAGNGGNDIVTTGSANDTFNFGGNLTDDDDLDGGAGVDTLNLDGPTTLSAGNGAFERIETVNLAGNGNNDYSLTLDNLNAPSSNGTLTIAGGTLGSDDTAVINTSAVTLFGLNITTGAAADTVTLGATANTVSTGAGADTVSGTIGAGASTIDTGSEDDNVDLATASGGSLNLTTGTGNDAVVVTGAGSKTIDTGDNNDTVDADGNANVQLGSGEDTLFVTGLNDNQTADGGAGVADLVQANSAVTDALFTNFSNFEVFRQTSGSSSVLGAEAQAAGIRTVVDGADSSANLYDLSAFTADVTVILNDQDVTAGAGGTIANSGGGNDTVLTGSGNDTVILDDGTAPDSNTINTGAGNDTIISRNDSLDQDDLINGGEGNDTIAFNNGNANTNIPGPVIADIDLDEVVSIENFVFTDSGDRVLNVVDADDSVIQFRGDGNPVGTLTNLRVDLSAVTDGDDSVTVILEDDGLLGLGNGVTDPDFAFTIIGAGAGVNVTVDKQNLAVDNNINFVGGASNDTLRINGIDLGSTITFTGGTGVDSLVQTGGVFTDDGFDNISGIEFLIGDGDLDATLGQRAEEAGFTNLVGGTGGDDIFIDAAFDGTLTVDLSAGGGDVFDGDASDAVFNFILGTAADTTGGGFDTISGGSTAQDTLSAVGQNTTNTASSNLNTNLLGVTGVETINFRTGSAGTASTAVLLFDTNAAEVNGGVQTINVDGDLSGAGAVEDNVVLDHQSHGSNDADIVVNVTNVVRATIELGWGDDVVNGGAGVALDVRTGAGDDIVTVGAGGQGDISGGDGNDQLVGNSGADVLAGGAGNDTISGGIGADRLFGGSGNDTISDGAGSDLIYGGTGGDTINLSADGAADTVFYDAFYELNGFATDSFGALPGNFDTINGFVSGTDKIGLDIPAGGFTFLGNVDNFAAVDSSLSSDPTDGVQAIYDRVANILYIDLNSDGEIDAQDLQIVVNTSDNGDLQAIDFVTTVAATAGTPVQVATDTAALNPGPQADTSAFSPPATNGLFGVAELTVGVAAASQP
jgi:hypothetical protein